MKIAVVYLGQKLPKYAIRNLRYLISSFPKENIFFISDNPKSLSLAAQTGVKTWMYVEDKSLRGEFESTSSLPLDFRNGFWYTTTLRFYALRDFMEMNPKESVLQVEADVWISQEFPFEKFRNLPSEAEIAFPLESSDTAAASILYLKDLEAANKLIRITKEYQQNSRNISDMGILGSIFQNELMDVFILPTAPENSPSVTFTLDQRVRKEVYRNLQYFGGIFDSTTYGLYVFGEDPRNHRGKLITHRNQDKHLVQCSKSKFVIEHDAFGLMETEFLPFHNLHVHSKDERAWKSNERNEIFTKFIRRAGSGVVIERKWFLTAKLALSALKRRVFGTIK